MDLHQVRYFLAIAQSGGFTAAAEVAFVTQPTLSSAIAKLEGELGVRLFERGTRGVRLTEGGQRFLPRARVILREMEIARADFRGGEQKLSPRLRVGLLNTAPMSRIAPVLRALMRIDPAVRWSLVEGGIDDLESQLNAGRLDLLITNLLSGRRHYQQLPLFADDLRLAVPAGSTLSRRRSLTLDALQDQLLIVRTHCEHLQHASRVLDREKIRPMVVYRTRFDERALALVAGQLGACFIPDSFSMPAVKMISVNGIDLPRTVGIQWPSAPPQSIVSSVLERFASSRRKPLRNRVT
jgi:DNA-binding transcriptional LysR family regulator